MGGDFLARILLALEGKEKVVAGLREVQTAAGKLSSTKIKTIFDSRGVASGKEIIETFKPLNEQISKGKGIMSDFGNAMRRALIVAPVWMVMRGAIQSVTGTISEGFQTWMEFDRALAKNKAVIHDYAGTTSEAMKELEERIREYSKESGQSLQNLAASFYRFGTVGIAFEDALSGAIASAKLAKATFGDVDTISRSLAMTYRLLGDTIDSSLTPMQKQESLAGKIYHLWKTNAFEANEFAGSLNNFISTANIANFTADQTVATLAALGTAGVTGSRGGTLLKTAIQKLVENLDKLAPALGLGVNPELENTFSLFMRVLGKVNELSKTTGIPKEAIDSINAIFGGIRGGQVISALNALLPELKKNLEDLGKDPQQFINGLKKGIDDVSDTAHGQMDIFNNLKKQFGESFVKGVLGAEDFKEAMKKANLIAEAMIPIMEKVGIAIVHPWDLFTAGTEKEIKVLADFDNKLKKSRDGLLSYADAINLISELGDETSELYKVGVASGAIPPSVKQGLIERAEEKRLLEEKLSLDKKEAELSKKYADEKAKKQEEEDRRIRSLSDKLRDKLELSKEELNNQILLGSGAGKLVSEHKKLDDIVSLMIKKYNQLTTFSGGHVKSINAQSLKALVLKGNFEGIIELMEERANIDNELNTLADVYVDIQKESLALVNQLVTHETNLAKIRGADDRTLLNMEVQLGALSKDSLEYRLRMEKLITNEKKNQFDVSSDVMKLYKVGKEFGAGAAEEISKVLAGRQTVEDLRGKSLEAFKKLFSQEYEAFKALQYMGLINFRGTRVPVEERRFWEPGGRILLPEERARQEARNLQDLIQTFAPGGNVEIKELLVNISTQMLGKDKKEQVDNLIKNMSDAILTDPTVRKAIDQAIEEY